MKRRIIAALCLALALLTLASCGQAALTVEVWRRTADAEHSVSEGLIQSERRSVQAQAGSINGAVSAFNAEPEDPGLARAAPGDAKILAWRLEGTELRLEVSPGWAELTGFDRHAGRLLRRAHLLRPRGRGQRFDIFPRPEARRAHGRERYSPSGMKFTHWRHI